MANVNSYDNYNYYNYNVYVYESIVPKKLLTLLGVQEALPNCLIKSRYVEVIPDLLICGWN